MELVRRGDEQDGAVLAGQVSEVGLLAFAPWRLRVSVGVGAGLDDPQDFGPETRDGPPGGSVGRPSSMASCSSAAIAWSSSAPYSSAMEHVPSRWLRYGMSVPLRLWAAWICAAAASALNIFSPYSQGCAGSGHPRSSTGSAIDDPPVATRKLGQRHLGVALVVDLGVTPAEDQPAFAAAKADEIRCARPCQALGSGLVLGRS